MCILTLFFFCEILQVTFSQWIFKLREKQRQFWNSWNISYNVTEFDFSFFLSFAIDKYFYMRNEIFLSYFCPKNPKMAEFTCSEKKMKRKTENWTLLRNLKYLNIQDSIFSCGLKTHGWKFLFIWKICTFIYLKVYHENWKKCLNRTCLFFSLLLTVEMSSNRFDRK